MIDKEVCELLDAISREKGSPMSPFEELLILGYYPEMRELVTVIPKNGSEEEEDYDDYAQEEDEDEFEEVDEEYEFDEDDEEYLLLKSVLRRNNDKKKYFA